MANARLPSGSTCGRLVVARLGAPAPSCYCCCCCLCFAPVGPP